MATYRILYWQEVPSQIKSEDAEDEVTVPLPARFLAIIDRLAMERGLGASDDYLAQWHWSEDHEREGPARAVAESLAAEIEEQWR